MESKISATVIVVAKDGKVLIVKRPAGKSFTGLWTVPGGKVEDQDGTAVSDKFIYYPTEACAARELKEETGISAAKDDLRFLCSLFAKEINTLILSYYVILDASSDKLAVRLAESEEYRWIGRDEVDAYTFIEGITDEINAVFAKTTV